MSPELVLKQMPQSDRDPGDDSAAAYFRQWATSAPISLLGRVA